MAQNGMLGFFGAAGLQPEVIAAAIDRLQAELADAPFGVNLIHTPQNPDWEERVVDLLLEKRVQLVEASAYLRLTKPLVRYRTAGIHRDDTGAVIAPNRVIAKLSRVEVARQFMSPPPAKLLAALTVEGVLTAEQAEMAAEIPMAGDITAEADSGGHTDNRPAVTLLPTIMAARDQAMQAHEYAQPIRIGLAGGVSTPASAAAAFAMGAAYVLVGSVNQACVESGSSDQVREMLAQTSQADIAMAPAADMFEMGVKLQVLKRGTMFAMRAARLYDFYKQYGGLDQLSAKDRGWLEDKVFRNSLEEIWRQTSEFFQQRDPRQLDRAERDPKHKMALVFRWYLGYSSRWANAGVADRVVDYQIWCGPSMGAFNEWVKDSFLESAAERRAGLVAWNILYGAARLMRAGQLRAAGCLPPADMARIEPRRPEQLKEYFG
jgi:PfaD family protein